MGLNIHDSVMCDHVPQAKEHMARLASGKPHQSRHAATIYTFDLIRRIRAQVADSSRFRMSVNPRREHGGSQHRELLRIHSDNVGDSKKLVLTVGARTRYPIGHSCFVLQKQEKPAKRA